jgi:cysteinyl-tRNA synthetase
MPTPENGIYVLQGVVPSEIAAAPVAVKVVDLDDDNGQLFTASQVAQMEAGNGQVLGYFSIGEAENYRSYFSSLPRSILGPVDPSWPGDYQVAYWTPEWMTVATNYIDQMIALGYNGAYFDVVDECETSWAKANAPGGDAKGAMINLIQSIASYAHAKDPNFQIWINASGAEDLLTNSTLVNTVDGAFEEELFYHDNGSPVSAADTNYNLNLLDNLVVAGKPVVAIEYITGAAKVADVEAKAAAAGIGYYVANPNLELQGVDTEGFATSAPPPPPPSSGPKVTTVSASPVWADLGTGAAANISLALSEAVTVTGNPQLLLNNGGIATYFAGSGTGTLVFKYDVMNGQDTPNLAVTGVSLPSGASVTDSAGSAADFTNATGSLNGQLIVDTSRTRTTITRGKGQTVNAGAGDDVVVLSRGSATLLFRGSNDVAFLGGSGRTVNATINDQSQGLTVYIASGGQDTISGLATDPTAVIDLLAGVGGYTSVSDVLAGLTSDNAGGALLPLGNGQSIDFTGVDPSSLQSANFKID